MGVKHNTGMPIVIAMKMGIVGKKVHEYSERMLANDDDAGLVGGLHGRRFSSHCKCSNVTVPFMLLHEKELRFKTQMYMTTAVYSIFQHSGFPRAVVVGVYWIGFKILHSRTVSHDGSDK